MPKMKAAEVEIQGSSILKIGTLNSTYRSIYVIGGDANGDISFCITKIASDPLTYRVFGETNGLNIYNNGDTIYLVSSSGHLVRPIAWNIGDAANDTLAMEVADSLPSGASQITVTRSLDYLKPYSSLSGLASALGDSGKMGVKKYTRTIAANTTIQYSATIWGCSLMLIQVSGAFGTSRYLSKINTGEEILNAGTAKDQKDINYYIESGVLKIQNNTNAEVTLKTVALSFDDLP